MTGIDDDLLDDEGFEDPGDVNEDVVDEQSPIQVPVGDDGLPGDNEQADSPTADGGMFPGLPCCCDMDDIPEDLGFEPVDPESVTPDPASDSMIGDPDADEEFWMYQGDGNGTCAPTSVAMMIGDCLGEPVSSEQVIERAIELGVLQYDASQEGINAWSGMNDAGIMILCESFGLDVSLHYGELDDLAAYLDAGHAVTVGIDADEVWYGTDDDSEDAGTGGNHQVVVTGIDPVNGLVYLNDSGSPDGQGEVVPLTQFMDAWADCANSMIVTNLPEDQAADEIDVADVVGDGDGQPVDDRIVPVDANYFIEPLEDQPAEDEPTVDPEGLNPIGAVFEKTPVPAPAPAGSGISQLLILPFTFIAHFADQVL